MENDQKPIENEKESIENTQNSESIEKTKENTVKTVSKPHHSLNYFLQLGWNFDPFPEGSDILEDNNMDIDEATAGYNDERAEIKVAIVKPSKINIIRGQYGMGKTHLINYARRYIENLRGETDEIIYTININGKDIEEDILKVETFKKRIIDGIKINWPWVKYSLMKKTPKDFVKGIVKKVDKTRLYFFIDEFQNISSGVQNILHYLYDKESLKVCGFIATTLEGYNSLDDSLKDRVATDIKLSKFTEEDAVEFVKQRIELAGGKGIKPFDDEKRIRDIAKQNGFRPRWINREVARQILKWLEVKDWKKVDYKGQEKEIKKKIETVEENVEITKEAIPSANKLSALDLFENFNKTEKKIFDYINANPGTQISDIEKAGVSSYGTAKRVLAKMTDVNGKHRAEHPNQLIPCLLQTGKGRARAYQVRKEYQDIHGTT